AISSCWRGRSQPWSLVISPGRTGTRVNWVGRSSRASRTSSSRPSPSRLNSTPRSRASAHRSRTSPSRVCRLSSRQCSVSPAAPARMQVSAATRGAGFLPPREFLSSATLLRLTDRFIAMPVSLSHVAVHALAQVLHGVRQRQQRIARLEAELPLGPARVEVPEVLAHLDRDAIDRRLLAGRPVGVLEQA